MTRTVAHTVQRTAAVGVTALFDVVTAEDVLPHVLHRWGPIPGVRTTHDVTGPWSLPGSSRTVVLSDGSTAREEVLEWERPARFAYRVWELDGLFGRQFAYAVGAWSFRGDARAAEFRWSYTFHGASALMRAAVPLAWARYMAACADRCVARAVRLTGSGS